jgi:phosphoribosylformylglycinamidine (FGAM) synthase-like amidotransferase family enzyme
MKFGFSSFGDFLFDGAIFDIYMQSKIMSSLDQVRKLKNKLVQLHDMLDRM